MQPLNPDGTEWTAEATFAVMQDIRKTCLEQLNKRDEIRSNGKMSAGNNYAPYVKIPKGERDEDGYSYRADPVCVAVKQTGDDQRQLFQYRWAEFCKVPQDETPVLERLRAKHRQAEFARLSTPHGTKLAEEIDAGTTRPEIPDSPGSMPVQDTVPPAPPSELLQPMAETKPEPMPVVHPQPKRKRGRPRKHPIT